MKRIVTTLGMDVILETSHMRLEHTDLSKEEKIAVLDSIEDQIRYYVKNMDDAIKKAEEFKSLMMSGRKYANEFFEIIKEYKDSPNPDITNVRGVLSKKARQFSFERDDFGHFFEVMKMSDLYFALCGDIFISCLLARKGENFLRYISIRKDPMITITGPDAEDLKHKLLPLLSTR